MDLARCLKCNRRLIVEENDDGPTKLRCLRCNEFYPLKRMLRMGRKLLGATAKALVVRPNWTMSSTRRGLGTYENSPPKPILLSGSVCWIWPATMMHW
jgi:DNA-directed RNA polymerase subunit RPC12/RpoP